MVRSVVLTSMVCVALVSLSPDIASAQLDEVLYLSDSHRGMHGGANEHSHLYRVELDTIAGVANLVLLPNGDIPFGEALGLACTPDGSRLYAFDVITGKLGYYTVATAAWTEVGPVFDGATLVPRLVQAAFSPDGRLFAASEANSNLYEVNPATGEATRWGRVRNTATNQLVPLLGADLAFASNGELYLWTNSGAATGFYRLFLPAMPGEVPAEFVGGVPGDFFTGISFRANGLGHLVGSSTTGNAIHVHDRSTGVDVPGSPYPMYLNGVPYTAYAYGDMANPLMAEQDLCTRTIGYWKNHSWPYSVSVCGTALDQVAGQTILWDARGNNFSMLAAQLIAAKLNTANNAAALDFVDGAESFLCANVNTAGNMWWTTPFENGAERSQANQWKDQLDDFNNGNHCED